MLIDVDVLIDCDRNSRDWSSWGRRKVFAQIGIRVASLSNECTRQGRKTEPKAGRIEDSGRRKRRRGFSGYHVSHCCQPIKIPTPFRVRLPTQAMPATLAIPPSLATSIYTLFHYCQDSSLYSGTVLPGQLFSEQICPFTFSSSRKISQNLTSCFAVSNDSNNYSN